MNPYYTDEETWIGYLWAVSAGAVSFLFLTLAVAILNGVAAADVAESGLARFIVVWCIFGVFYWTGCFLTILGPFVVVLWIDHVFRFHNLLFYLAAGFTTGFILNPVFMLIHPPLYWVASEPDTFLGRCVVNFPWAVSAGIIGGVAFWWRTGRHLGRLD